jgi:hypothetical protein
MADLGSLVVKLSAETSEFRADLGRTARLLDRHANDMKTSLQQVSSIARTTFAVAIGATSVAALRDFVSQTIEAAAALQGFSEQTGASAAALSGFAPVATISGTAMEAIGGNLAKLSKGLAGVDDETAGATKALQFLGIRAKEARTTLEALARLKPVVHPNGSVTAGNASGVNDGACALLMASEDGAKRNGLIPRARIVGMATAGVAPRIMGIGPAPAAQKVLALTGLTLAQMDVIELNEAFAAQGLAVLRMLGLQDDDPRVNAWGGAIALGHPLGASGARLATTAVNQLHASGGRYALCTMCIGVGQGIAVVLERV